MSQRGYSVDDTRHGRWRTYGLSRAPTRTQRTCMFAKMAYLSSINTSACLCNVSRCCVCRVFTQFKSRAMPKIFSAHESCDPSPPPPPRVTHLVCSRCIRAYYGSWGITGRTIVCTVSGVAVSGYVHGRFFHGASTWVRQATGWLASPAHST